MGYTYRYTKVYNVKVWMCISKFHSHKYVYIYSTSNCACIYACSVHRVMSFMGEARGIHLNEWSSHSASIFNDLLVRQHVTHRNAYLQKCGCVLLTKWYSHLYIYH